MKGYSGIGSRETPPNILKDMEQFALMAAQFMLLRSGAADGADTAFETGCIRGTGAKEIFLPWKGFNKNGSILHDVHPKAFEIAATVHPYFQYMRRPVKSLIARNMHQVLGPNLDTPVEFVICWTKDGCESHTTYDPKKTGGTGSAIALASKVEIPVYNLYIPNRLANAYEHLQRIKAEG